MAFIIAMNGVKPCEHFPLYYLRMATLRKAPKRLFTDITNPAPSSLVGAIHPDLEVALGFCLNLLTSFKSSQSRIRTYNRLPSG